MRHCTGWTIRLSVEDLVEVSLLCGNVQCCAKPKAYTVVRISERRVLPAKTNGKYAAPI
jgi:cob(I)alamin adenosyltransferase